jgi:hypothetical protein
MPGARRSVASHRVSAIAEMDDGLVDRLVPEPALNRRQNVREVAVDGAGHSPAFGVRAAEIAAGEPLCEHESAQSVRDFHSQFTKRRLHPVDPLCSRKKRRDILSAKINTRNILRMSSDGASKPWTFVTNHTQVLLCLAKNPHMRMRDVADSIGITERAAQRIVADLVEAGYVDRVRNGRRNEYTVNRELAMRHAAQMGHPIGGLLDLLELDETRLG